MKKIVIMILSAVCVFATLSFVACGKEKHKHSFTIENATSEYLCSEATCIEAAKYYYSCSCGEKGTATFDCGEALGHSFTNYEPNNDATYEKDGTKTATYNRCSATDTILDEGTKFESKIIFKSLVFDGLSASLTVPNAQNDYNFLDEIEIEGIADYKITTDEEGNDVIEADNINLSQGNNIFYVKMYIDGECKATYIITFYRRFIYTVTFNTNGGSEVESQQVEEDFCATMPDAPTKDGYTFDGWDYDFTKPVKSDIVISAKWTANKGTAYKVEYYLQNLEDDNYTLEETSNLTDTTDATVNAEQKTFGHFTLNEDESNLSGNVNGDGSLVLKVYYTRNTYKILAKSNDNVGTFTKINGTYRYNKELSLKVTSTNLGYIFEGWYDGETLLSTEKEYVFTVEKAVTITANWEMDIDLENFEFTSTEETCVITGVKNKSITSVKIPDYVTSIGSRAFYNCSELISIEIPNNVTTIKDNAFV